MRKNYSVGNVAGLKNAWKRSQQPVCVNIHGGHIVIREVGEQNVKQVFGMSETASANDERVEEAETQEVTESQESQSVDSEGSREKGEIMKKNSLGNVISIVSLNSSVLQNVTFFDDTQKVTFKLTKGFNGRNGAGELAHSFTLSSTTRENYDEFVSTLKTEFQKHRLKEKFMSSVDQYVSAIDSFNTGFSENVSKIVKLLQITVINETDATERVAASLPSLKTWYKLCLKRKENLRLSFLIDRPSYEEQQLEDRIYNTVFDVSELMVDSGTTGIFKSYFAQVKTAELEFHLEFGCRFQREKAKKRTSKELSSWFFQGACFVLLVSLFLAAYSSTSMFMGMKLSVLMAVFGCLAGGTAVSLHLASARSEIDVAFCIESIKASKFKLRSSVLDEVSSGLETDVKNSGSDEGNKAVQTDDKPKLVSNRIEDIRDIDGVLLAFDSSYLSKPKSMDDLPYNWVLGTNYDREEALRRWIESLEWRRDNHVDHILEKGPFPTCSSVEEMKRKFFLMKSLWPQHFLGVDDEGNLVTLERFHGLDNICKEFRRNGITPNEFAFYCVFLNEYWIHHRMCKTGQLVKIMDVSGLSIGFNIPLIVKYFGRMNGCMQKYPEIVLKSYFVNVEKAGTPFKILFKLLPRFLDARTFAKIQQVKLDTQEGNQMIRATVDPKLLPKDLGGEFIGDVIDDYPLEHQIAEYVRNLK